MIKNTLIVLFSMVLFTCDLSAEEKDYSIDLATLFDLRNKVNTGPSWERRRKKHLMETGLSGQALLTRVELDKKHTEERNNLPLKERVTHYFKSLKFVDAHLEQVVKFEYELINTFNKSDKLSYQNFKMAHWNAAMQLAGGLPDMQNISDAQFKTVCDNWELWLYHPLEERNHAINNSLKNFEKQNKMKTLSAESEKLIKEDITKSLANRNIIGDEASRLLAIEWEIKKKLFSVDEQERDDLYIELHVKEAEDFIVTNSILHENMIGELNVLAKMWDAHFFMPTAERISYLKNKLSEHNEKLITDFKHNIEAKIKSYKPSKSEMKEILDIEMGIFAQTLKVPNYKREELNQELHVEKALEKLKKLRIRSKKPAYLEKVAELWKKWLYHSKKRQKEEIETLVDYFEEFYFTDIEDKLKRDLTFDMPDKEFKALLKIVTDIEKKLVSVKKREDRQEKREQYYQKAALKMLKAHKLDKTEDKTKEKLLKNWKKWFYVNKNEQKQSMSNLISEFQAN